MQLGLFIRRELITSARRVTVFPDRVAAVIVTAAVVACCALFWDRLGWERTTIVGAARFGLATFGVAVVIVALVAMGLVSREVASAIASERDARGRSALPRRLGVLAQPCQSHCRGHRPVAMLVGYSHQLRISPAVRVAQRSAVVATLPPLRGRQYSGRSRHGFSSHVGSPRSRTRPERLFSLRITCRRFDTLVGRPIRSRNARVAEFRSSQRLSELAGRP